MTRYEITVELPNGDWVWTRCVASDYHEMLALALDYAFTRGGRVHHVEKLGKAQPGWEHCEETPTTVVDTNCEQKLADTDTD